MGSARSPRRFVRLLAKKVNIRAPAPLLGAFHPAKPPSFIVLWPVLLLRVSPEALPCFHGRYLDIVGPNFRG